MPVIQKALDALGHAVVPLAFYPSAPRLQALQAAGLPSPPPHLCNGMLDTGASVTVIDPRVRHALGLTPYRIRPITVPSHPVAVYALWYKVDLLICDPKGGLTNGLRVPMLSVVETPLSHTNTDVLVGCDVLSLCTFVYSGQAGSFSLSY
jgi:hypothetical protein